MRNVKRIIITTTANWWGLPKPEGAPCLDGFNAGREGSRKAESGAVGVGQVGALRGDLCGCESSFGGIKRRFGQIGRAHV